MKLLKDLDTVLRFLDASWKPSFCSVTSPKRFPLAGWQNCWA